MHRIAAETGHPMSALGQKRTFWHLKSMSALPPKADIRVGLGSRLAQLRQLGDIGRDPPCLVARSATRHLQIIQGRELSRVVPRARWHAPCVMASLTGLLDHATADNESKHNNESE